MTSIPSIPSMTALCCLLIALFSTIQGSLGFFHCKSISGLPSIANYSRPRHGQQHSSPMGVAITAKMAPKDDTSSDDLQQQSRRNNRRALLSSTLMGFSLALSTMTTNSDPAFARDEIFKSNPLTNPILEQVRL